MLVASRPEVEWDETQQNWMLALADYRAGLCPNCGRHLSVCTATENEGKFKVGLPTRCHATTAVEIAQKDLDKYKYPRALMFSAEFRP